jgi:phosphopentomutase
VGGGDQTVKAIVLVLDGVGIGRQPEAGNPCPPEAHTLANTARAAGLHLPTLAALGLGCIGDIPGVPPVPSPRAGYGRSQLRYVGADSYLGHQEILGVTPPAPRPELLAASGHRVLQALQAAGHRVTRPRPDRNAFLVDDAVLVGDNLEAEPGAAVNLLVPTSSMTFDSGVEIGSIVRTAVSNPRVIVCGGANFTVDEALAELGDRGDQIGVPTPAITLYDQTYQVRHLGLPVDSTRQLPHAFTTSGLPVGLFGKVADLAHGDVDLKMPTVDTAEVLSLVTSQAETWTSGLIVATVQETDLAGHEQDPVRMARTLGTVDAALPRILDGLEPNDVLVITADHGNDPTIGSSAHTRECVPLLWYRPGHRGTDLGIRSSLADPAATIAATFGLPWRGEGEDIGDVSAPGPLSSQGPRP